MSVAPAVARGYKASMDIDDIDRRLRTSGFVARGGFYPKSADGIPVPGQTVIMIGNVGTAMWDRFQASLNKTSSKLDPLDRWTKAVLSAVAEEIEATPLFPFDGPPHLPFQRWARRADDVYPSPIGPLIHPYYGLWHAYRGAFVFKDRIKLPERQATDHSPCDDCTDKPCLTSCPVDAFSGGTLNTDACTTHLFAGQDEACFAQTCRARSACPVGRTYAYHSDQGRFHMSAYLSMFSRHNGETP